MREPATPKGVREFYDDLAATYDLIYADWERSIARQAAALDTLIRAELGEIPVRGLDCACGIGTQLIGLAPLGYDRFGADLSPVAAARANAECAARGLVAHVCVADMRALPIATVLSRSWCARTTRYRTCLPKRT